MKLGANDQSQFFFRLPSDLFRTLIVRVSRPITDRKKNQSSAGLLFTLSYELLYIKISIKNHERSSKPKNLQPLKSYTSSKEYTPSAKNSFVRKIHEISQFFLVAFCFFVNVFLVCSHSCRKTLLQSENATRKQTKMNEQKFHISQEMVLLVVIGIRNVDLMRIKIRRP